jgi:hypothetical protein
LAHRLDGRGRKEDRISPHGTPIPSARSGKGGSQAMSYLTDWLIAGTIGVMFTLLGSLKLYGYFKGTVGGHDKPLAVKLCGT